MLPGSIVQRGFPLPNLGHTPPWFARVRVAFPAVHGVNHDVRVDVLVMTTVFDPSVVCIIACFIERSERQGDRPNGEEPP